MTQNETLINKTNNGQIKISNGERLESKLWYYIDRVGNQYIETLENITTSEIKRAIKNKIITTQ